MKPHASAFAGAVVALRRTVAVSTLLALALLAGCAALPADVQRPSSAALADVSRTVLADIAEASTPRDKRGLSGFRLLPDGAEGLAARQALLHLAQKSLDVQYYLIAADDTRPRSSCAPARRRAARRAGAPAGRRPARRRARRVVRRAWPRIRTCRCGCSTRFRCVLVRARRACCFSLHDFDRINRRMHNKLFIADNTFAVTGGRNIADEYFMRGSAANFIDMDVLSTGPVVRELSGVFDSFWNSELAFPDRRARRSRPAPGAARDRFDALRRQRRCRAHAGAATRIDEQLKTGRLDLTFAAGAGVRRCPRQSRGRGRGRSRTRPRPARWYRDAEHAGVVALGALRGVDRLALLHPRPARAGADARGARRRRAHFGDDEFARRHRRAAGPLGLCALSQGHAEDGRGPERTEPDAHPQGGHARQLQLVARAAARQARGGRPALADGGLDEHGLRSSRSNTELGLAIDSPELAAEAASLLEQHWVSATTGCASATAASASSGLLPTTTTRWCTLPSRTPIGCCGFAWACFRSSFRKTCSETRRAAPTSA